MKQLSGDLAQQVRATDCFIELSINKNDNMEKIDTKQIGNITELEIMAYITKLGYQVSIPYGDRARYDQIWDINNKLLRVQVKTAHLDDNCNTLSINCHTTNRAEGRTKNRRYTKDEIDCIATYFNNRCYCIPIESVPSRSIKLRINPTSNNQQNGIHLLNDYLVEFFLEGIDKTISRS